ncbi:MAG: hypothetical protein U0840_08350 [Gemmataceae bacterium]
MTNEEIAIQFQHLARDLDRQGRSLFEARAYRGAAMLVRSLPRSLEEIFREGGRDALRAIPGMGDGIALTLEHLLPGDRPRSPVLPPLADSGLRSLPGVGRQTVQLLGERLQVTSLEQLQEARRSGELQQHVPAHRLRLIMNAMDRQAQQDSEPVPLDQEPSVEVLLAMDCEYRARRRPAILGRMMEEWQLQATRASSALAHRRDVTGDWVTIRFEKGHQRGERTILTETRGPQAGHRVVRGREAESVRIEEPQAVS